MDIDERLFRVIIFSIVVIAFVACGFSARMGIIIVNDSDLDLRVEHGFNPSDTILNVESGQAGTFVDGTGPSDEIGLADAVSHVRLYFEDSLVYEQDPLTPEAWIENWINDDHVTYTLTITNDSLAILLPN